MSRGISLYTRFLMLALFTGLFVGSLPGQEMYHSLNEIKKEWKDYTVFQKDELLSFCDYLYQQRYYDRAVVSYYQYIYRFPEDPFEPAVYFRIAKCYEMLGKYPQALENYEKILNQQDSTTIAFAAANYRHLHIRYLQGDYQDVYQRTEHSDNPYLLILRAYSHLAEMNWSDARKTFLAAEERFNDIHYSEMINPLMEVMDARYAIPEKSTMLTMFFSLMPGGGRAYLEDWNSALGTLVSTSVLVLVASNIIQQNSYNIPLIYSFPDVLPQNQSTQVPSDKKIVPRSLKSANNKNLIRTPAGIFGVAIYTSSIWGTYHIIHTKNRSILLKYIQGQIYQYPAWRFLDFTEPEPVFETRLIHE